MKIKHINWGLNERREQYEATICGGPGVGWSSAVIFEDGNGDWNLNYESKCPQENILKRETLEETIQAAYSFHRQNVINDFGDKSE